MNEQVKTESNQPQHQSSTFFEFIEITVRYRWFLIWFILAVTVSATAYALLAPKWYKATASVLPAEKNDLLSTLSGISSLAKGFSASKGLAALTGGNSESDKFLAILKSATVVDDVIKKFDLRKEYERENDYYEKVVKEWMSNCELNIQDEGNLTIAVYDKDPKKAADIANYLVAKLNEVNTTLSVTNAKANREFVEKRYLQSVADINNLENSMRDFQEKYGVIAVPQQLEATVKSMSNVYVELYKKEVEYNVMKQTYGADYPLTQSTKVELQELQKKIGQINSGSDAHGDETSLLIPFKKAPKLGNEYLKIYRNLEIQYKILEFIQPLYEQAKIEEVRNTPSVLVLDKAAPPDRKAKPKGTLYALISFVASLIVGYILILFRVLIEKLKREEAGRYRFIAGELSSDISRIFRLKKGSRNNV